jgi:hypothetical protein
MRVAIIKSTKRGYLPAILTRFLTGCSAYHIGFYSETSGYFYDMDLRRRRILWADYFNSSKMETEMFPCDDVSESYLKSLVLDSKYRYGFMDYILFLFRKLGFKVKNRKGLICSEMVNNDLLNHKIKTPWARNAPPPSPCDFLDLCRRINNK